MMSNMLLASGGGGTINPAFTLWYVMNTEAAAVMTVQTNGTIGKGGSGTGSEEWFVPTTPNIGSSFYFRAVVVSGAFTLNQLATWTQLTSNRNVTVGAGGGFVSFYLEVARNSDGTDLVASWGPNVLEVI